MIGKATAYSEAGKMPSAELIQAMGLFNPQLIEAGVTDGGALKPSSQGARVAFDGAGRGVRKGPFEPAGELVSGYWIWNVKDLDEAIDWLERSPNPTPGPSEIEVRPLHGMEDFQ